MPACGGGDHDADEGGIAAVLAYGVGNEIELGGELIGDHLALRLIPVEDDTLDCHPLENEVTVDADAPALNGNVDRALLHLCQPEPGRQFLGECGDWP